MRIRQLVLTLTLLLIAVVLMVFFPPATQFVEAAALDIRRFWWMILGLGLAVWLYKSSKE